jgi:paraquat-inducible protein A
MKLENEAILDELIMCPTCHTLHKEVPLSDGSKACCSACHCVLYRYDSKLLDHGLALSLTAFVMFLLANFFPLVQIEILGHEQFITISKTFLSLFEHGFYLVSLLCAVLIFLFPLTIIFLYISLFTLLKLKRGEQLTKKILVLLSHLLPWSMSDIFLISILVALVKLIGYAQIQMGIAFYTLILFVLIDIYITKNIQLSEIWMLRKRIFFPKEESLCQP